MHGRYVEFAAPGKVCLREYELPEMSANRVLVEMIYTVISPGTERAFLRGEPNTDTARLGFPYRPGYSGIGRVVRVGANVPDIRVGQLLATMTGHQSHAVVWAPPDGASAVAGASPPAEVRLTEMSWRVPDGADRVTQRGCAGFIVFMVGLFGVRRGGVRFGDQVVVLGLGPVGLSAGQFARLSGAVPVIGVAATPERRRIAEEMGFDNVCANVEALQRDTPRYADAPETVVIEATGRPDSVLAALRAAPVGARIVLLGSTRGIVSGIDVYSQIHRKAVTVIGAHQMTRPTADPLHGRWAQYQDAGTTLQAILGRRLDFGRLVPTECAVRDVDDAYRTICERPDALCIALRWDAS